MKVKIKKLHPDAVIPSYAKAGDAGMDLTATDLEYDISSDIITYKIGLAFEIPEGHVGLLFPRSSIYKTNLQLVNSVGVIDSGYRGEVMLKFKPCSRFYKSYNVGDRVGQIVILPFPKIEFEENEKLEDSDRGEGGHGSTGN